jgi:glycosyltransferase involved in cell wall biosynthesis
MRIIYLALIEIDISNACLIHSREIVEQMAAHGHEVHVVLPRPLRKQAWKNVEHIWIRFWGFDRIRQTAFFLESSLRILWAYFKKQFDALYIREMREKSLLIKFLHLLKIPFFIEVNGWLVKDLMIAGADTKNILAAEKYQRLLFKNSAGIIASEVGNADLVAKTYKIPFHHIHIRRLGAKSYNFENCDKKKARKQLGLPLNSKIIFFAGSFHQHHDLQTLVEAFLYLSKKCPESVLLMVGTGEQFSVIQKKIPNSILGNRVILTGVKPYEEMPMWLRTADIAVLPLTAEKVKEQNGCFALKLWEYMAAGLPVVATDLSNTASSDLLSDKALLVTPDNPKAMGNAILRLIEDTELRKKLSIAGKSYVIIARSWQKAAKDTLDFMAERLKAWHLENL